MGDFQNKSFFILGLRIVGSWLEFDLRNPEGLDRTFYYKDSVISKQLNVQYTEGSFKLRFSSENLESGETASFESSLSLGDMLRIKLYIEYLFPVINGWHAIMNPSVIENDLRSSF